jgi:hypothetical protein
MSEKLQAKQPVDLPERARRTSDRNAVHQTLFGIPVEAMELMDSARELPRIANSRMGWREVERTLAMRKGSGYGRSKTSVCTDSEDSDLNSAGSFD